MASTVQNGSSILSRIPKVVLEHHINDVAEYLLSRGLRDCDILLHKLEERYLYNMDIYEITIKIRDNTRTLHHYRFEVGREHLKDEQD